ncbi:DUF4189 domain-containing protein [Luteibacter sp. 329MFSha]|uniref:DUF4189 domain-containing protein n=1 Tax=Luteibacter sp. 329MFSha TaxID=1798239 RepID=UPI000B7DA3DA|nr:DUF4189 domain-containing protein [Luteibacter sp. 329MFSha]
MKYVLIIAATLIPYFAYAEGGCPPGHFPQRGQGWQTCVPDPEAAPSAPPRAAPHWEARWSAISVDTEIGAIVTAVGYGSQAEAEKHAIHDCTRQGGNSCKVGLSVKNGCLAMAVGEKKIMFSTGSELEKAESRAMESCLEKNSKCRVFHSFCRKAELVP